MDFSISVADLVDAEQALLDYDVDLAIRTCAPTESFKTVARVEQSVFVIMAPGHPLADNEKLSLSQCVEYPLHCTIVAFRLVSFLRHRHIGPESHLSLS